jgi:hypothetical protein
MSAPNSNAAPALSPEMQALLAQLTTQVTSQATANVRDEMDKVQQRQAALAPLEGNPSLGSQSQSESASRFGRSSPSTVSRLTPSLFGSSTSQSVFSTANSQGQSSFAGANVPQSLSTFPVQPQYLARAARNPIPAGLQGYRSGAAPVSQGQYTAANQLSYGTQGSLNWVSKDEVLTSRAGRKADQARPGTSSFPSCTSSLATKRFNGVLLCSAPTRKSPSSRRKCYPTKVTFVKSFSIRG